MTDETKEQDLKEFLAPFEGDFNEIGEKLSSGAKLALLPCKQDGKLIPILALVYPNPGAGQPGQPALLTTPIAIMFSEDERLALEPPPWFKKIKEEPPSGSTA